MNVALLIDAIVRQTTVLVAQLATAGGTRAPLANMANQVFLELIAALKDQGLGHKVIADMFGLALRTYHGKVRRLSESTTVGGQSLWSAALSYVQERGTVSRLELLQRFHYDDAVTLKGVLNDLVDSGLLFRAGRGDNTSFRAAEAEDAVPMNSDEERLQHLLWVAVHRFGPTDVDELLRIVPAQTEQLEAALDQLVAEGKVMRQQSAGTAVYRSDHCLIPVGEAAGWEASVFDHYQAVVTAIASKLAQGNTRAASDDRIGGSTYHYDVWPGHPHYDEVAGHLAALRALSVRLREKVEAYNRSHAVVPEDEQHRFIAYVGQTVRQPEGES